MPTSPKRTTSQSDRRKLIAVCLVLVLAIGWLVYLRFNSNGKPAAPTGATAIKLKQDYDAELNRIKTEEAKRHPIPKAPSGA